MQFIYMGFDQQANTRCFRFQGVQRGERPLKPGKSVDFTLTADMLLLNRYKIGLQDVPGLCLQILTTSMLGLDDQVILPATYPVTSEHLTAFTASRDAARELNLSRRKPRVRFRAAPVV